MTLEEFGECIEFNIEHNLKHAVLGLGAPGIGKSQLIQQIGKKYGYKVIDLRLAQMSEVEIGGLIYPNEDKTKTRWLTPEILPDEKRDGKKTILLLDEITSCNKRVQVAAYQLILDRRVGQYELPEGTFVIALGNREEDDGVYVQLAAPLADRFEILEIDVDYETWKRNYAIPYQIHPYIIRFLNSYPRCLHTQKNAGDEMVFATPRSWTRVSDVLKYNDDVSSGVVCRKIIGNIGWAEGSQFIEFCKNCNDMITAEEFLAGVPAPESPEKVIILLDSLTEKVEFIRSIRTLSSMKDNQRKLLECIIESFFRLPSGEFTVLGLRKLLEMNRSIVKGVFAEIDDPAIISFVKKNNFSQSLERRIS